MILSAIAAVAANGVIGREQALPWHLPADLRRFKQLTTGHPILMGRRTWETIGRPLPRRRSIVLTRRPGYTAPGAEVATDLDTALAMTAGEAEAFVIGGAAIYALALPRCDRLYLTRLEVPYPGDTYFPAIDPAAWELVDDTPVPDDPTAPCPYRFQIWARRRP